MTMKQDDSGEQSFKLKPGRIKKETHRFWAPKFRGAKGCNYAMRVNGDLTGRGQVSVVKCRFEGRYRMTKSGLVEAKWGNHGYYLARKSAGRVGRPQGFNFDNEDIQAGRTLTFWEESGDERYFKFVLSPERGDKVDLKEHAREVVYEMQNHLGTKLEWFGVAHDATDSPHVHLCIRGVDRNKQSIFIDSDFIKRGMRRTSEEKLTRKLGLRRKTDMLYSREKSLRMDYYTAIDGAIIKQANEYGEIHCSPKPKVDVFGLEFTRQKVERLLFLESLDLATKTGPLSWKIDLSLETKLRKRGARKDVYKKLSIAQKYKKGPVREEQKAKTKRQPNISFSKQEVKEQDL